MKKLFTLAVFALLFSAVTYAQKAKWAEMDSFHTVMAQTFHPAEEGKFEPIKSRSAEMVQKATAWKSSSAPAGYDKEKVETSLTNLVSGAKEIDQLVKSKATDAVLKEKLSKLHDTFHEIMEKCEKEDQH